MDTKVIKVGTSLGLIIPKLMAKDYDLQYGTKIEVELKDDIIVIKKKKSARDGWRDAFAQYAKEGEDRQLLPDHLDSEVETLL